jgi:alpha-tubulin suppressor-like RCC1 family protein
MFDGAPVPTQVGSSADWREVLGVEGCPKQLSRLGIRTDGTLWAWGSNSNLQLGFDSRQRPVLSCQYPHRRSVGTDTDWKHVSAGGGFSMAIKNDNTLWPWGANNNGQLGNGTTLALPVPTMVDSNPVWLSVSTSSNFSQTSPWAEDR